MGKSAGEKRYRSLLHLSATRRTTPRPVSFLPFNSAQRGRGVALLRFTARESNCRALLGSKFHFLVQDQLNPTSWVICRTMVSEACSFISVALASVSMASVDVFAGTGQSLCAAVVRLRFVAGCL